MRSISNGKSVRVLAAAAAVVMAFYPDPARAETWDGNGNPLAGGLWNTNLNWDTDTVPNAISATATFPVNTGGTRNITFTDGTGPYTVGTINFPSTNANGPSTIGATDGTVGLIFDNAGAGASVNLTGSSVAGFTAANYINFRAPITLNEQLTCNVDPRGNGGITLNFLGATQDVAGAGGMTKNGLGVMSFADSVKTFTGPVIVNQGRVRMQGTVANLGGLTGTSAVTVNAAGPTHLVGGLLNVPEGGQLQFDTAGTGSNHFGPSSGATTVVTLNGGGMFDTTFSSGLIGAIRNETNRITQMNNAVVLQTNSVIATAANVGAFNSSLTLNGVVSGSGMLISNDHSGGFSGTLVLAGNNTYTGGTMVNNGTLTVTHANGLGASTGQLIVNNVNTTQTAVPNSTVTVNLFAGGPTTAGSLSGTISNNGAGTNTATINAGANQFTVNQTSAGTFQGTIAGTGGFRLGPLSNNTLTLTGNNTYTGGTTVEAGKLRVKKLDQNNAVTINGGTLEVMESSPGLGSGHPAGDNAFVSRPTALTIAAGGTLDLTNNDLILDYSGATPIATYEALVASAYNVGVGDWSGTGITSSVAQADGNYVIAIADNAALAAPFGTTQGGPLFSGVDVDIDTILIKFTHRADVDLDGVITPNDAAIFGGNYSENDPAVWATGDMDYDGIYTPNDAAIFGGFYDESLASLPEPASLGMLGLLGLGLARRRRQA